MSVDNEIDYAKHTESELVEMFGRLDPRWASAECARLARFLTEHGYLVTVGTTGPGSAVPGPAKLLALIGTSSPFECAVAFGPNTGLLSDLQAPRNTIGFVGGGTLVCDGVYLWLSGRVAYGSGLPPLLEQNAQLACRQIANVESHERLVRFEYDVDTIAGNAMCLWLADATGAARLAQILPKRRTNDFRPRLAQ